MSVDSSYVTNFAKMGVVVQLIYNSLTLPLESHPVSENLVKWCTLACEHKWAHVSAWPTVRGGHI